MRAKIAALWTGLVLLGLMTLLWLVLIARGGGLAWDWGISVLVSWWMTVAIAASATAYAAANRLRFVTWAGMAAAVGVIATLFFGANDGAGWIFWGLWLLAAAVAQVALVLLLPVRSAVVRAARAVTFVALGVMCGAIYLDVEGVAALSAPYDEWQERAAVVGCVLNTVGTIAVYMLAAIEHLKRPAPQSIPADVALEAACPRCGARCTFCQGASHCRSCGLRVTLEIEEPRCACGYLLYKLDSEQCPECGRVVRRPAIVPLSA